MRPLHLTLLTAVPLVVTALTCAAQTAAGSLIVTYAENANAIHSSLSGTSEFTFDSLALGTPLSNVAWEGVGEFDNLYVIAADNYGGAVGPGFAGGSPYSVQSTGIGGVSVTTLTLNSDHAYFGMWWSAGDANNVLRFFNDKTLIAEFTTDSLLNVLAANAAYKGNPRDRGLNAGEPYAFINFFGGEGTTWDHIELTNEGGSGFESDNYTDRAAPWTYETDGPMPGVVLTTITTNPVPVPEPSAFALGALGLAGIVLRRRRA